MYKDELISYLQIEEHLSKEQASSFWNHTVGVMKNIEANKQKWSEGFLRPRIANNANILVLSYLRTHHEAFVIACGSPEAMNEFAYELVLSFVSKEEQPDLSYSVRETIVQSIFGKTPQEENSWKHYTEGFSVAA